ncbi:MAG: metallophosphoesterase family protein [Maioricimonas sp. JB045]
MTRIAIVSDTHGHVPNTLSAIGRLAELNVAQVIHCGDIGSPSIVPLFESWPTHFVFGNVDGNEASLRMAITDAGQSCHGRFGELEVAGRKIAFLHSDDARRFSSVIDSQVYDLVCYGHTHSAEHHHEGKTLVLNPGALYRAQPHSLAVVDLPDLTVESVIV